MAYMPPRSGLDPKDVKYGQLTAKPLLQLYSEQKDDTISLLMEFKENSRKKLA